MLSAQDHYLTANEKHLNIYRNTFWINEPLEVKANTSESSGVSYRKITKQAGWDLKYVVETRPTDMSQLK